MKNAVFWDVSPCRSCENRRFGGMYLLHLQGRKIRSRYVPPTRRFTQDLHGASLQLPADAGSLLADFSILKMEAVRSSETSVHTRATRR
jgi:hypothetical protein